MMTANTVEQLDAIGQALGLEIQEKLAEGEFMNLVTTVQGLLGVNLGEVEEEAVTRKGLAAASRLLRVKGLGIETQEGRRTTVVLGIASMAARQLLEESQEEDRWINRGP